MMRYLSHLLSWLCLITGIVMMIEHLPPSEWSGDPQILILEAINRVAFVVAGVGLSLLGVLGVYGTRTVLRKADEYLMNISRGVQEPDAPVTKPSEGAV